MTNEAGQVNPLVGAKDYLPAIPLSDTVPVLDGGSCLRGFLVVTTGTLNVRLLNTPPGTIRSIPATACIAGTEYHALITHVCTGTTAVIIGIL